MSGDRYVDTRIQAVDCVTTLHKAMQDAGGSILDVESLETMTVMQFITTIAAQNNIRFHYKKQVVKNENG